MKKLAVLFASVSSLVPVVAFAQGAANPVSVVTGGAQVSTVNPFPTNATGPAGILQGVSAAGAAARVSQEPTQLFWDDFGTGTLDTTNKWTSPSTGGGGNPSAASNTVGSTTLGTGTSTASWSILTSQFSFPGKNPSWNFFQEQNNFEFPVLSNAVRFWGFGTFPGTPTATATYADAVGFELGLDGHLRAVMSASPGSLAAGTKTIIADLSVACASINPYGGPLGTGATTSGCAPSQLGKVGQPQDNGVHKYIIYFRGDNTYWAIDGIDNVVAFTITGAPGPNANTLPIGHIAVASATTANTTSALITINQVTLGDTGRNEVRICDNTNPWRCAGVTAGGNLLPHLPITAIAGNGTGTTGSVVGTLTSVSGKTTYICGFSVAAVGGTASVGPITLANIIGTSQIYQGSSSVAGGTIASQQFNPCIPANNASTNITVTTTGAAGATAVDVNSWGFQQ